MQLFKLLGLFERCSGLKINESKLELLWLGSWRHRKDKVLNLQISEEPVHAFGVLVFPGGVTAIYGPYRYVPL